MYRKCDESAWYLQLHSMKIKLLLYFEVRYNNESIIDVIDIICDAVVSNIEKRKI